MNSMISMQWHPMHALHDAHKSLEDCFRPMCSRVFPCIVPLWPQEGTLPAGSCRCASSFNHSEQPLVRKAGVGLCGRGKDLRLHASVPPVDLLSVWLICMHTCGSCATSEQHAQSSQHLHSS